MEKTSKELLNEFVNSQHFTSTTDIMNRRKNGSRLIQAVSEAGKKTGIFYPHFLHIPPRFGR